MTVSGFEGKPPSAAQLDLIDQLAENRCIPAGMSLEPGTMSEAATLIDRLKTRPERDEGRDPGDAGAAPGPIADDGGDLVVYAKVFAIEVMVEMLWASHLAQMDNPKKAANDLKSRIMDLVKFDQSPEGREAKSQLQERLDAVITRVWSL